MYILCIVLYIHTYVYTNVLEKDYIRLGNIYKLTIKKSLIQETQINI